VLATPGRKESRQASGETFFAAVNICVVSPKTFFAAIDICEGSALCHYGKIGVKASED